MSNLLTWSEAEIFNARFESYDVYRAVVDPVTNEIGEYVLLVSLPITYDWDMAILDQTLQYTDSDTEPDTTYAYKVIANASNGAGDPDGDFTQVSNVIQLVSAPPPEGGGMFLHVAWRDGTYHLFPQALDAPVLTSFSDMGLGVVYGITVAPNAVEGGIPEIGLNGAVLEAAVVGGSSSPNMGESWEFNGGPIYSNGSNLQNRVAYGDGIYFMGGARTATGLLTAAYCNEPFGVGAFTWTSLSAVLNSGFLLGDEGGQPIAGEGIAGVFFNNGYFMLCTMGGHIARCPSDGLEDVDSWEVVVGQFNAIAWDSGSSRPQARFAAIGDAVFCCLGGAIAYSNNNGQSWDFASNTASTGWEDITGANPFEVVCLAAGGGLVVAGYQGSDNDLTAAYVAVGAYSGSNLEVTFERIYVPGTGSLSKVMDIVYDSAGERFIFLVYTFDATYGSSWSLHTMDLSRNIEITFSTGVDHDSSQNAYLALSIDVDYTPPEVPNFVAFQGYTIEAIGGSGSGNQEPNILVRFGAGDTVPLGQFYMGGGAMNTEFDPAFLVDDGEISPTDPDPLGLQRASYQPTGQWWSGVDPPDPTLYEVRFTPQLGSTDPASSNALNEWCSMADEPYFQYFGVFGPPANAVIDVEIRNAMSLEVLASGSMFVTQNVG